MARKGVGGGRPGGGGGGKGRQGPRQPSGRKEGRAGAKRPSEGERFRPAPSREKPERGPGKAVPFKGRGPERARVTGGKARVQAGRGPFKREDAPQAPVERRPFKQEAALQVPDDMVMGVNPVLETLRAGGRMVDSLYIDKEKGGPHFSEMVSLARASGVTLKVVPREALDKMAGGLRHQGAIAVVAPKAYADPDELVGNSLKKGRPPILVILDGVEDPQNLGSIVRTAESAGADGVIIPEHRAAHMSASVARASAGALEHMPVAKVTNVADFLTGLKQKGFWVVGLEGDAEADYTSFDMNVPVAVVLGSEGKGVRPLVRKACDALVSLPMFGKVNSLNVSVAAGIVLYEVLRQRRALNAKAKGLVAG